MTPESPQWLLTKGQDERAKNILICYHANGVYDDEMVNLEFREVKASVEAEERGASYSWLALFSTKGNIKRTVLTLFLGLGSQWVGNGIISYYLSPILESIGIGSSRQQIAINGGLQIFNWTVSAVAAFLAERLGRRTLLLSSAIGMVLSMSVVTACSATYANTGDKQSGTAVIVFLFLFFGAYDVGFTPIPPLYVNEIASTHLSAKYGSLYWFSNAVALCFNQYVNPIAFDAITWKYYLVYISVLCPVIAVLCFYAPETKGWALEQVVAIFDGDIADGLAQADNETKTEEVSEHREFA
ncbi:hexose transporter [Penicillium longicatenatum]|uniref:hexose transporter n=1 Tax=Penicillium longicatenatum TaxID=1561947 RepID=UPI002547CA0E|nr:hexose transporter [Penicillium longicatenatum]KAJ5657132.1 hexose transporter [Penicillium longicatenatum]